MDVLVTLVQDIYDATFLKMFSFFRPMNSDGHAVYTKQKTDLFHPDAFINY